MLRRAPVLQDDDHTWQWREEGTTVDWFDILRRGQALGASLAKANAGLNVEVAERRRVQESLRESEARFRRLANNVPGMV